MYDSGRSPASRQPIYDASCEAVYPLHDLPESRLSPTVPSLQARLIARALRRLVKPRKVGLADITLIRGLMTALTRSRLPLGIRVEQHRGPTCGEWVHPTQPRRGRALLYLHGGGYLAGSPRTHRAVTARLAATLGVSVFVPDYRLAPEHPFPAALQDTRAAWQALMTWGFRADRLWLAGDSAGGGLALGLMQACRQQGLPLPRAAALFSPWTDLTCTSPALTDNAERCAWFRPQQLRFATRLYAGRADPADPRLSPLFGDLSGLPPLVLHVSDTELLRDDSLLLATRARAAGTPVHLEIWHGLPHAWPNFAGLMPEADACLRQTAAMLEAAA